MSSPFKTFEEFNQAEGPIYTFANNPGVIAVFLILTALILLYFIYKSFNLRSESSPNFAALSLLAASAISLAGIIQAQLLPPSQRPTQAESAARRSQPFALLGMVGLGSTRRRSRFRSKSKRSRRF